MNDIPPDISIEYLTADFIPLYRRAMKDAGSAAQTLGVIMRLATEGRHHRTFASTGLVAKMSCVCERTAHEHMNCLTKKGWIESLGREPIYPGCSAIRRTVTYRLTDKAIDLSDDDKFAVLPRWAARALATFGQRAVYAEFVSRHLLVLSIEDGCAEDRYRVSISDLESVTGLSRRTVINARRDLLDTGAIVGSDGCIYLDESFIDTNRGGADPAVSANNSSELEVQNLPTPGAKTAETEVQYSQGRGANPAVGGVQNLHPLLEEPPETTPERTSEENSHENSTTGGPADAARQEFFSRAQFAEAEILKKLPIEELTADDESTIWRGACLVAEGLLPLGIMLEAAERVSGSHAPARSIVRVWRRKCNELAMAAGIDAETLREFQEPDRPASLLPNSPVELLGETIASCFGLREYGARQH